MISFVCACGKVYSLPDNLAGRQVRCVRCNRQTRVAADPVIELSDALSLSTPEIGDGMNWITMPLVISAISNLVIGVILLGFCIGAFWILLGIFEIVHFARSGSTPPLEYCDQSRRMAVAQWIFGLLNWITLICGIVIFIKAGDLRRRIRSGY